MENFELEKLEDWVSFCDKIKPLIVHKIFLLKGQLGAGKTTFTNYFIQSMDTSIEVSSPTYSLINEYQTSNGQLIYHMDLYRLNSIEEILNLGIEEYLDSGSICIIEWPETLENILYNEYHTITIKSTQSNTRMVSFV